ncbi:MAG: spfh domain, band 7 family protein [Deltaproteobacteria bacterium]|nr:spfh domain, band 7 family protein [Deltaproteobacteria bacterium]
MTNMTPLMILALFLSTGCTTILQNEVGVRRTFGRLEKETLKPGLHMLNPFTTSIEKLSTYTRNLKISTSLPSREGLTVQATISILYRVNPKRIHVVLRRAEKNYESNLILSIFRSASADVCARYPAKDMHSGRRSKIEHAIQKRMTEVLSKRGFIVEAVLLKNISLPPRLANSIEQRLSAEQDAMRMRYILEREKQEAQRKKIEAMGERDAQKIRSQGITEKLLRMRYIEAFERLAKSSNSKVIITSGSKSPVLTLPATNKKKHHQEREQHPSDGK